MILVLNSIILFQGIIFYMLIVAVVIFATKHSNKDQYKCKPSTGYVWNSYKKQCCRPWNNECFTP